jgi:hypothetical protein
MCFEEAHVGRGVVRIASHSQFDIFGPLQTAINRTIPEPFLRMVIGWPKVADSVTRNVILEAEWLRFVSRLSPELSFNSPLSSETFGGMTALYNTNQ